MHRIPQEDIRIGILGLGYVGLPLAMAFAGKYRVTGYDIVTERVRELTAGHDHTGEVNDSDLLRSANIQFSEKEEALADCNTYIITVPTPVTVDNGPDLGPLLQATATVARHLSPGDTVIYESTVYPGCTEEQCVPLLEQLSGLVFNKDFFCGYSPERINPGDKEHSLTRIRKITSGSTPEAAERIDALYASVITAGTHRVSSIRVAEAAKVIENTQRDINIAFVNELAKIFNRMQLDTREVLEAASTKWNFLPFKPGLVGGHCIGVDPYYLVQKARELGYQPDLILAGRTINESMGVFVAEELIRLMLRKQIPVDGSQILILGITFKENCNDIRNTRVIDIIRKLQEYHCAITVCDPLAIPEQVEAMYGIVCHTNIPSGIRYHAAVTAVSHAEFATLDLRSYCQAGAAIYDVKGILPEGQADQCL
jgi:UDP-N-acetyl-D-galactosamine dehydrogenase